MVISKEYIEVHHRSRLPKPFLRWIDSAEHTYEELGRSHAAWAIAVAGCRLTPPEALSVLASSPNPAVRVQIAVADNLPAETLSALAQDPFCMVRSAVAGNWSTPPETLLALAGDACLSVQEMLAGNSSTPVKILRRYAEAPQVFLRVALAKNGQAPSEALLQLVEDEDSYVPYCLARNICGNEELYRRLSEGQNDHVWLELAYINGAVPEAIRLECVRKCERHCEENPFRPEQFHNMFPQSEEARVEAVNSLLNSYYSSLTHRTVHEMLLGRRLDESSLSRFGSSRPG
jgi:hypothetical protein